MCKFDQYLHTSRKSGINVYAICVGWVNFVHNLRCLLKNLRSQQKFYATAGPTGPDKYELWLSDVSVGRYLLFSPDFLCNGFHLLDQGRLFIISYKAQG